MASRCRRYVLRVALLLCLSLAAAPYSGFALAETPSGEVTAVGDKAAAPVVMEIGANHDIHAVLIGINQFAELPVDLHFAEADALAFGASLKRTYGAAIKDDHLRVLTGEQATLERTEDAISRELSEATRGDTVILFVSSHGLEKGKDAYVALAATNPRRPKDSALSFDWLRKQVQRSKAQHVLVFLDTCYSGNFVYQGSKGDDEAEEEPASPLSSAAMRDVQLALSSTESLFIMTSSGYSRASRESSGFCDGHGAFTCGLLEAFDGRADTNRDERITFGELYLSTAQSVTELTGAGQLPSQGGDFSPDMPIAAVSTNRCFWPTPTGAAVVDCELDRSAVDIEAQKPKAEREVALDRTSSGAFPRTTITFTNGKVNVRGDGRPQGSEEARHWRGGIRAIQKDSEEPAQLYLRLRGWKGRGPQEDEATNEAAQPFDSKPEGKMIF